MDGGFVSWEDWEKNKPRLCRCCLEMMRMPTEEEMEQLITEHIDAERIQNAILNIEIETLKKAVEKCENVSAIS